MNRSHIPLLAGLILALSWLYCCSDAAIIDNSYRYYRLPSSLRPERYKLKVITYLENPSNLTFEGQVSIRFKVLQDTTNITLHSQNLTIDESRIKLKSYDDDQKMDCLLMVTSVPEQDYFIIQLCQTLRKGQEYKLKLYFTGILNEKLHGYYRSSYVVKETNETRWLSVTQFEPAHARAAFPCFDEPEYKARFVIWMGHHKSLTALSNMPLKNQTAIKGLEDFVWSSFEESVPMSTYLVAYTVNDFAYKKSEMDENANNNIKFRTWARPDAIDQCVYASEVGPKVLKYYEDTFGIPFPLKKIDEIAIPDFAAGAMENWGLVTYRETALLFAPNVSSNSNKLRIAQVIAHELAHQWFGNLVTMKWWTDLWLNEGFATYVASLGVHHLSPEWESYNDESLENILNIFRRDAQLSSHPISQPILNTSQIGERFDAISYKKGSAVLRMLHSILDKEAFFEGVRDYLKKHEYDNAEQDDLWLAFTEKAHRYNRLDQQYNMKTIMDSWTLQTGYPLVRVKRNYKTGSVEISQHRFLENKTLAEQQSGAQPCWWVPLSYTTAKDMNFVKTTPRIWLECDDAGKSKTITLDNLAKENEWLIFNIQLSGVYRVMYDLENWRLLNETLNSKEFSAIHVMNRAQVIDDSLYLAWSGYSDYDITFDILGYLTQEREYLPWKAALEGLANVNRLLRPFTAQYELFKRYVRHIITPVYNDLGGINATAFDDSNSFSKILHKALTAGWACRLEMEDCVQNSIKYFNEWKSASQPNEENKIPVDLRPTVYCTAIRHGNEEDWNFLWQRYKESNVATEKRTIIFALSCSRNKHILRNYIDMTYERGQIRKQDSAYAFSSIIRNEFGFALAKDYYMENIDKLNDYYGRYTNDLSHLLSSLAGQIILSDDQQQLAQVIEMKKDLFKKSEKTVQSAFETINFNLDWIDHNVRDTHSRLQTRLRFIDKLQSDQQEKDQEQEA